jgi:4'-phosphopantetheinyl transferase
MAPVHWLQQTQTDVPLANDWLSEHERQTLRGFRFAKRRSDWRLGRWTAKHAVAACLGLSSVPVRAIELRPDPSGAPEVFVDGCPAPVSVSLSHRLGRALCVVVPSSSSVGCDVELVECRSDAFVTDYFTPEEQDMVRSAEEDHSLVVTLIWSAKESVLKAVRKGLRVDTREVNVIAANVPLKEGLWSPVSACFREGEVFRGWSRRTSALVWTVLGSPSLDVPVPLQLA